MERRTSTIFMSLLVTGVLLATPRMGMGQTKNLTLDEAVKRSIEKGPGISVAKESIETAKYGKKKAFAGFFPILSFELRALYYNEAPGISSDMGAITIDPSLIPAAEDNFDFFMREVLIQMGDLFGSFSSFKSEQYDVNITLSLTQPLTPLYQVYYGYKLADLGVDVAEIEVVKARQDLVYNVKEAYYSILKIQHGLAAMDEGIGSVTAHVQKAELFFQQKIITKNDLLQAKARLAELEAQRISMEGTLQVVVEGLNFATGIEAGTTLVLEEPAKQFDGKIPTLKEALKVAKANRTDLQEMRLRIEQAGLAEKIAIGEFIPQVAAIGTYTHNEGSLMTYPPLAVGGVLSWNFWAWGSKYYGVKEAKSRTKAAKMALASMESAVAIEVEQALSGLQVSVLTLEKAEASVEASEEQLRIEKERYAQNVNTSTEVLDAQTRLTQALLERENARYDIFIALAKLEKATGKSWQ